MSYAIEMNKVSRSFLSGGTAINALSDVCLKSPTGGISMITGPSGCGKTTLLTIAAGLLRPSSGSVKVLGSSLDGMSERERIRFRMMGIGFVFQQYTLVPTLTAVENVAVPLLIRGERFARAMQEARCLLNSVGLCDRADAFPAMLSGGQQQRVSIARAIVARPPVVICDELTAALDGNTGLAIMDLLKELVNKNSTTVLVVSHDNRIFSYAQYRVEMSDGRILPPGATS